MRGGNRSRLLTPHQQKVWDAYRRLGGYAPVAKELGMSHSNVRWIIERAKMKLQAEGKLEAHQPITPENHHVKGVSTLLDESGEIKGQWVKTQVDEQARELAMLEAVREAFREHPKVPAIAGPRRAAADLMACYPMGDPHIGLYAWGDESGDDFDLKIAEDTLIAAAHRLVNCAPPTDEAMVINLGDFFHADTTEAVTLGSRNHLDVDTRWAKVLRVGLRIMRTIIETALTKHKRLRVINEIGNHDEHTSQLLTLALSAMYERNKRVSFDESPARFHYHRFGSNLIGIHHGDTVKPDKLGEIMAADRPDDWGQTRFRYWFTGHVHHRRVFELPGCTVESFRTLAAKDAWHASSGYRSGRDMQAIVLHKDVGEVERHRVDIAMVKGKS